MVCPAPVRGLGCAATKRPPALTDRRGAGPVLGTSHGLSLRLERGGGVSAGLLHFPARTRASKWVSVGGFIRGGPGRTGEDPASAMIRRKTGSRSDKISAAAL